MTTHLYACAHAEEFPAQALLRLRTDLAVQPVVVLDGRPPLQTVCSLNRLARLKGAVPGLTRLEAETIPGLHLLARSLETEAAARAVLLECAAHFSPRIESVNEEMSAACVLDITGTERLFGPPETLAARLRDELASAGLRASVAVSANFHAARMKAAATRGITVIPPGQESIALSRLPLAALDLPPDPAETFAIWGIRTLAELAALPESDLVARLGPQALDWRNLARGELPHTFQPIEAGFSLAEFCAFETPVEQIDSLLFIGARMIDCLATRASTHALSLASLTLEMKLDGGRTWQRTIRPALATVDRKFLLKLLQLEIAAHPPQSAVLSLTLSAQAGQSSKVQLGLFAPQTPEPSRLDVTIARLKAIAGEDRVGSPVLEDTHRPGSFRMESFVVAGQPGTYKQDESVTTHPRIALRRIRPPAPVRVEFDASKPIAFRDRQQSYKVAAAYGPWRTSGCWWSTEPWDTEEWDVLAEAGSGSSLACLLVRNCTKNQWQLEAFYD
ncbi:MAG TPA: DNA polymerase Y family protein [Gemmataceae bacterium]|nr:DNA polymerase Y family protein [Gemmataceae bacterium]